ncbi:hypothetical protein KSP40_PGU004241 [Platanthera guangdongensis]|uniref:Uncharacterized protein n=1 Tax=Platanthera guangdongensis TaxID=2320717 RepID=A0ABR2LMT0_9ASPA
MKIAAGLIERGRCVLRYLPPRFISPFVPPDGATIPPLFTDWEGRRKPRPDLGKKYTTLRLLEEIASVLDDRAPPPVVSPVGQEEGIVTNVVADRASHYRLESDSAS